MMHTKAMNSAVNEHKADDIKTFYYYKVCDSILELDITYNEEKLNIENEKEESKCCK